VSWGRTNLLIAAAARALGATAEPLSRRHTDLFMRLGRDGRAVIVSKTRSPFLTQVAQTLSNNKFVSRELLAARGIPTVPGVLVDEEDDVTAVGREALARWGRVVVKPNWGNRGVGVTTDCRTLEVIRRAVARAQAIDDDEEAVVEPFVAGTNVRVCVIGGQFAAAAEVQRPVLRAGRSAAAQVAAMNEDVRRGSWDAPGLQPMDRVVAEEDLAGHLEVHGVKLREVVPDGVEVEVTGEEAEVIDRTEELHPGWARVAVAACGWLGVDVGGVDLRGPMAAFRRAPELADGTAGLLEVNVRPALHLHALPTQGAARAVFERFVAYCLQIEGAPEVCARVGVVDVARGE
jgi:D-alanine-D-alanine ligase-like ATP-grasp enzyme